MGGGVAGLTTALVLARDGHHVTVLERDAFHVGAADDAPAWPRRGIPHFLQPHAFIPRGRNELRTHLPDVFATLLDLGAYDVDVARKTPGGPRAGDEDLCYLAVRRPVIEWALRRAIEADGHSEVRSGVNVRGVGVDRGRVSVVRTDAGEVLRRIPRPAAGPDHDEMVESVAV